MQLLVLSQLPSHLGLRCEVLCELGAALGLLRQPRQQRSTYARALELCVAAAGGPHGAVAGAWAPRLQLAAARLDAAEGDAATARAHAAAAAQAARQSGQQHAEVSTTPCLYACSLHRHNFVVCTACG